jgi:hypothetical protein
MTGAHRPFGAELTYEAAASLAGKHLSTVYRWVEKDLVRERPTVAGPRLSEADVIVMKTKRWTRAPRPPSVGA